MRFGPFIAIIRELQSIFSKIVPEIDETYYFSNGGTGKFHPFFGAWKAPVVRHKQENTRGYID